MERAWTRRLMACAAAFGAAVLLAGLPAAATAASNNVYTVTKLVSDVSGAANTDSNLVNAWGLTSTSTSPWWVADNGADVSTVYAPGGTTFRPPVQVSSAPTGA